MKSLRILNSLLTLFLISLVISIPILIITSVSMLSDIENNTSYLKILNQNKSINDYKYIIVLYYIITLICYTLNVYGVYLIKQNVTRFTNLELFTKNVMNNFYKTGWVFIISFISLKILTIFIQIDAGFITNQVNFDIINFTLNPINGLIIGILFLILSKVFEIAKKQKEENIKLKQENELTI